MLQKFVVAVLDGFLWCVEIGPRIAIALRSGPIDFLLGGMIHGSKTER